jgi:methyl-accepting chemotaxis protein
LLVATVAASVVLGRSGVETYESRINSALAAASVIISGQGQVLTGDFQTALKTVDTGRLVNGDATARQQALLALMQGSHAERATLTDSTGKLIVATGAEAVESEPWLASSARVPTGGGVDLVVNVFRPFDLAALNSVFRSQGLQWGFASGGELPEDTLSRSIDIPAQMLDQEAVVYAGVKNDTANAASVQALQAGLGIMVMVALIAALLGFLLARTITRPLRDLTEVALAGTHGDLDRRVDVRSHDEIGSLGESFNAMQDGMQRYIGDLEESRTQLLLALSLSRQRLRRPDWRPVPRQSGWSCSNPASRPLIPRFPRRRQLISLIHNGPARCTGSSAAVKRPGRVRTMRSCSKTNGSWSFTTWCMTGASLACS